MSDEPNPSEPTQPEAPVTPVVPAPPPPVPVSAPLPFPFTPFYLTEGMRSNPYFNAEVAMQVATMIRDWQKAGWVRQLLSPAALNRQHETLRQKIRHGLYKLIDLTKDNPTAGQFYQTIASHLSLRTQEELLIMEFKGMIFGMSSAPLPPTIDITMKSNIINWALKAQTNDMYVKTGIVLKLATVQELNRMLDLPTWRAGFAGIITADRVQIVRLVTDIDLKQLMQV